MRIEHKLPERFLRRRAIEILIVGAGGTGSAILMGLPYLHQAMLVWGHPYGLMVTVMDPDAVCATNCVRQPFSTSDIGQNKATVLVNRINLSWGTNWSATPEPFTDRTMRKEGQTTDLLIGCVDTKAARRSIDKALTEPSQGTISGWILATTPPAESTSLVSRSTGRIGGRPSGCALSVNSIPRSSTRMQARMSYRVVPQSRP